MLIREEVEDKTKVFKNLSHSLANTDIFAYIIISICRTKNLPNLLHECFYNYAQMYNQLYCWCLVSRFNIR